MDPNHSQEERINYICPEIAIIQIINLYVYLHNNAVVDTWLTNASNMWFSNYII